MRGDDKFSVKREKTGYCFSPSGNGHLAFLGQNLLKIRQ